MKGRIMEKDKTITLLVFVSALSLLMLALGYSFLPMVMSTENPTPSPTAISLTPIAPRSIPPIDKWSDSIERWSAQYGVPGAIIRAVILQESGGNPNVWVDEGEREGVSIVSKGLFQVIDAWGRFSDNEDPFDPDTNAREGMKFLIGCNKIVNERITGRQGEEWQDVRVLYDTFACYNAGPNRETWPASSQRYARNVLSLATGVSMNTDRTSTYAMPTATPTVNPVATVTSGNMCWTHSAKQCKTQLDWDAGWCDWQINYAGLDMSLNDCVHTINNYVSQEITSYGR